MSRNKCCVPGCQVTKDDGIPLHRFPEPKTNPERYTTWVSTIGSLHQQDKKYVYNNLRVCREHFKEVYLYPNHQLCKLAIPELQLSAQEQETAPENLPSTSLSPENHPSTSLQSNSPRLQQSSTDEENNDGDDDDSKVITQVIDDPQQYLDDQFQMEVLEETAPSQIEQNKIMMKTYKPKQSCQKKKMNPEAIRTDFYKKKFECAIIEKKNNVLNYKIALMNYKIAFNKNKLVNLKIKVQEAKLENFKSK